MKNLLLLLVWGLLASCEKNGAPPAVEVKVLKTYEAPTGTARELKSIIRNLGSVNGRPEVESEALPDGKIAIFATESFHRGVGPLLTSIAAKGPPETIDFQMWQVIGKRAEKSSFGPGLDAIHTELEATAKAYGPMEFSLHFPARLQLLPGEHGEVENALGIMTLEGDVTSVRVPTHRDHSFRRIMITHSEAS